MDSPCRRCTIQRYVDQWRPDSGSQPDQHRQFPYHAEIKSVGYTDVDPMKITILLLLTAFLAACAPASIGGIPIPATPTPGPTPTEEPKRPLYSPGELVDYTAQSGDTLPALAARFNTTEDQIRQANPVIPEETTTMPPGMPMKIPIYYLPFWGTTFQIIPDSQFVNGPSAIGFDTKAFVASHPGWLKDY